MPKFKIGDYIVGNDQSRKYSLTSITNVFVGRVVGIVDGAEECIRAEVVHLERFQQYIGRIYPLEEDAFELAPRGLLLSLHLIEDEGFQAIQDNLFKELFEQK